MANPLLLIHGLFRSSWDMYPMARYFRKKGYTVYNYGYYGRKHTIEEQAQRLCEFIDKEIQCDEIDVVAHSLGSIITRHFIALSTNVSIKRFVMLGPPNNGSSLAKKVSVLPVLPWFYGPAFNELCLGNFPQNLKQTEVGIIAGGTKGGRGFNPLLSGNDDGIVTVEETHLDDIYDYSIVHLPHPVLMLAPSVMKQAERFIQTGSFTEKV